MSSPKAETTEAKIARLEEHESLEFYKIHCRNVKDNEGNPDVVKYWKAVNTYNAKKDKQEVKKLETIRGRKDSAKEVKDLREIEAVRKFEKAEEVMNELADKEPVKKHRAAKEAKERMEKKNLEVVQYNMAKESLKASKKTNEVKQSHPEPSGSSTGSTRNSSNAGNGNGTQSKPRLRKEPKKPNHPKEPWITKRDPEHLPGKAPRPASDGPSNAPRGRSRDRSNPQTDPKPSASAPKNDKTKINSGKQRVPSRHTEAELNFKDDGADVVGRWKPRN